MADSLSKDSLKDVDKVSNLAKKEQVKTCNIFHIYTLISLERYSKRDKYLMHNFISGKVIISKSMSNCALHAKLPPGLRENNDVI